MTGDPQPSAAAKPPSPLRGESRGEVLPSALNSELLLEHFHRLAEAPDAIPRLRRFILDLAVRGKLVEPNPKDEPASELLKRIEQDVRERKAAGKFSDPRNFIEIPIASLPFGAPASWRWSRLIEIAEVSYGYAFESSRFSSTKTGKPLIRIRDISNTDTETYYDGDFDETYIVRKGDYLVGMDGDFNLRKWKGPDALLNQRVMRINNWRHSLVAEFLEIPLQMILLHLHGLTSQTTVKHLSAKQTNGIYLPLPPVAEQHRIVAKVDELMALCDRLEAAQAERESRRDRLAAASLNRLNDGTNAEAFPAHARFYLDHLPQLTIRPAQIPALRQTILNLAVRGKLSPQDPKDEAATQLAICDKVRQSTAKKDHRANTELQTLLAAEEKWDTPSSWEWRALADLVLFVDYRGKTPNKVEKGVRLITAKNVKRGFINLFPEEFLSESNYHPWMTRGFPKVGDVLFTTEAPMGNAAVVRLPERFALAQRVICFQNYGAVNPDFLVLQLLAGPFQFILDKTATGLTAKGIKAAKLKRLPVVVPPLAEQHRIVAKVDKLMALCDRLEAQLTTTQVESRRLLEAVLHQALEPVAL